MSHHRQSDAAIARCRAAGPVHQEAPSLVSVCGYAAVRQANLDAGLSSHWMQSLTPLHRDGATRAEGLGDRWMMFADGPRHRRYRAVLTPIFATKHLGRMTALVDAVVREVLEGASVRAYGHCDGVTDLAAPIASRSMCELVGLGSVSSARMGPLLTDIADLLVRDYVPEVRRRGEAAVAELDTLVEGEIDSAPAGSALAYLRGKLDVGELERHEVVDLATLLAFAGYGTSVDLLSNLLANLVGAGVAIGAVDVDNFVEECLRLSTPVQSVARFASDDVVVDGKDIARGSLVLLQLAVANRDVGVFEDPDELGATLPGGGGHLAFGHGPHYCLGASVARTQAAALCRQVVTEWAGTTATGDASYTASGTAVYARTLPMQLSRGEDGRRAG